MPTRPSFDEIRGAFPQVRQLIDRQIQRAPTELERQQLSKLTAALDQNFAEFVAAYPVAMAEINAKRDEVMSRAKKVEQEIPNIAAQVKAAAAEYAKKQQPGTPPPAAVDPELGQRLRSELLERFAPPKPGSSADAARRHEIWEDWDWDRWRNN